MDTASHRSRVDTPRLALALAITVGLVYLVCAAFVAAAPTIALQLLGWIAHVVNVDELPSRGVTPGGILAGFAQVVVYTYLATTIFGLTFNALDRVMHRTPGRAARRTV